MIRLLKSKDIDKVMQIWMDATMEAHPFLSAEYWEKNYTLVKDTYIPLSRTYVLEDEKEIKGFVSIIEDLFIGALFVKVDCQHQGIGGRLINHLKKRHKKLNLAVYTENFKGVGFYKKMGFLIECEQINEDSNKSEYLMSWEK